jgi:hypothetical protein
MKGAAKQPLKTISHHFWAAIKQMFFLAIL